LREDLARQNHEQGLGKKKGRGREKLREERKGKKEQ
jgi:hypothetical protein